MAQSRRHAAPRVSGGEWGLWTWPRGGWVEGVKGFAGPTLLWPGRHPAGQHARPGSASHWTPGRTIPRVWDQLGTADGDGGVAVRGAGLSLELLCWPWPKQSALATWLWLRFCGVGRGLGSAVVSHSVRCSKAHLVVTGVIWGLRASPFWVHLWGRNKG